LILSLGEFDETHFPSDKRETLIPKLEDLYRADPDPGIHAASEWLLRRWKPDGELNTIVDKLKETDPQLQARKAADERSWYINSQGQTMVIIDGPVEFNMGSPENEPGHNSDETLHATSIGHRFAIAAHEVTVGQFRDFREQYEYDDDVSPDKHCPVNSVLWYDAAAYCNWLSEQEGIAESQWCYRPIAEDKFAAGMTIEPDYLTLRGYRLPTEAEWEYACRASSETAYCFGDSEAMLENYACYSQNPGSRTFRVGSLKPNDFGLFDMHGNAFEWCQDSYHEEYTTDVLVEDLTVKDDESRVLRGGSFFFNALHVRSAYRVSLNPVYRDNNIGFRVARTYN